MTPDYLHVWGCNERPAQDIDEVAIWRRITGDPRVVLTRPERLEAVRQLTGRGWSLDAIADRLGVTQRTIVRDRNDLHLSHAGAAA